jgi:hypothetical protein
MLQRDLDYNSVFCPPVSSHRCRFDVVKKKIITYYDFFYAYLDVGTTEWMAKE